MRAMISDVDDQGQSVDALVSLMLPGVLSPLLENII